MKTILYHLLLLVLIATIPSCSKKPVQVSGQIFVVTKSRDNIKMGGLDVYVIPDSAFQASAKFVLPWMQDQVKKEAQSRADSDYMTSFIKEVMVLEKNFPEHQSKFEPIRMGIAKESGIAEEIIQSALTPELKKRAIAKLIEGSASKVTVTTDADGRFVVPITEKTWFVSTGERSVGDQTERYLWVKSYEVPENMVSATMTISNDADIDEDNSLYNLLNHSIGSQSDLNQSKKVEVSEKMKTIVEKNSQKVSEIKASIEKQIAEAKKKFNGNRAGEEKTLEIAPRVKMTFCWCPAGDFTMGSPELEGARSSDEKQVKVTLTKGFWMAKTEVTQAQWEAVMRSNPSLFKGDNLPVVKVSWNDAQEFLEKLNALIGSDGGGKMVLPTESQWEYACRAGEAGPFSGGTIDEVAWYSDNSGSNTHPVGTKKPNAWGLHDMHGNVWEWCQDCYNDQLLGGVDPRVITSGTHRVYRGGGWNDNAYDCRAANRDYSLIMSTAYGNNGFRVARSSVP